MSDWGGILAPTRCAIRNGGYSDIPAFLFRSRGEDIISGGGHVGLSVKLSFKLLQSSSEVTEWSCLKHGKKWLSPKSF